VVGGWWIDSGKQLRPCRTGRRPAEPADTLRLKSIGAIHRREFVPRDPRHSMQL